MLRAVITFTVAVLIGLSVFVWAEQKFSENFQSCIAQKTGDYGESTPKQNDSVVVNAYIVCSGRFVHTHNGEITALATLVIAAFTATLWRATDKLWTAGEGALTIERKAREAELRPYIYVDRYEYMWMNPPNRPNTLLHWRWTIIWKNTGQTPAQDIQATLNTRFFPNGQTPESINFADVIETAPEAGVCAPGQELRTFTAVEPNDLHRAWSGEGAVYVWGWIEYDGLEGASRHRSEVCRKIEVRADPRQKTAIFGDTIVTPFNAMDHACVHEPKTGSAYKNPG